MGAITPIATGLSTLAGTVGTVGQIVNTVQTLGGNGPEKREQDLALQQLQDRQRLQQQQTAAQAALERDRLSAQAKNAEEDRRRALRSAVARQRANFGAQGVSGGNGSGEAVLLGLFDESEEDLAQRTRLDALKNRAIDLGLSDAQSLNVLQRTQLQQRQALTNNLSGSFGGLF